MLNTFTAPSSAAAAILPSVLRAWFAPLYRRPAALPTPPLTTHELRRSTTLTLVSPKGKRVECLSGCLWITLDHDTRDFIIEAGKSFVADRDQHVLVHALEASRVRVVPTAA